jgi:hypothetical protein
MDAFDKALDRFHRDGSFIYQKAYLNIDHITRLKASLVELNRSNTYQFHLSDVRLDPYTTQPTLAPVLRRQSTRTSRSNSSSSSEGASGSSDFSERIAAFEQFNEEQAEAKLTLSRDEFANELLSVFQSELAWRSIKIERVYFQQGPEEKNYLDVDFHRLLLIHLAQHDSLKTLSLAPFLLNKGSVSLGNFLTRNAYLQYLSLGLTAGKLLDWENLGLKLAKPPGLKKANFKNTALNNANCPGLLTLAENCYKKDIAFPELRLQDEIYLDMELREKYQALTNRLSETSEKRFKKERLSEASILNLVISALVKINSVQKITYGASSLRDSAGPKAKLVEGAVRAVGQFIDATVNEAQVADRRSERSQSKDVSKSQEQRALKLLAYLIRTENSPATLNAEIYRVLPKVYQDNWEYFNNDSSLLKLNLKNPHPDKNQSIASFLLDKVYEIGNVKAFRLLLEAQVNVFEPVTGVQEAFLVKAFKNNAQDMRPFRQALLEHIIQDNKVMEEIEKQLEAYSDFLIPYQNLIKHLDRYAKILRQREQDIVINQLIAVLKSALVFIWKEDTAAKRPEEFSGIKYHLERSVQGIVGVGDSDAKPGINEFKAARECFEKMMEISEKAQKGRFFSSNLHDGVMQLSKQLIAELNKIQDQFTDQYKGKAEALTVEQEKLKEKLSQTELRCEEKVSEIKKEMQAQQAYMQAEQDRIQEERAEMERRVEARMQELERLFRARMELPQNQATTPDNETAGSSTQFFAGRR